MPLPSSPSPPPSKSPLSSFSAFPPKLKVRPNRTPSSRPPINGADRRRGGRLGGPCNYTSFLTPRPRRPRRPPSAAQGDVAQFLPDPWPNQRIISSARAGRGTSASIFHRVSKKRVLMGVALQAKFTLEMYCSPHIVTGTNWPTSCRDEIFVTSTIGDLPSFLPACPANAFLCLLCPRVTQLAREEGARGGHPFCARRSADGDNLDGDVVLLQARSVAQGKALKSTFTTELQSRKDRSLPRFR